MKDEGIGFEGIEPRGFGHPMPAHAIAKAAAKYGAHAMPRNFGQPGSLAHVYARLHANRFDHIDQARRAREMQARLAEANHNQSIKEIASLSMIGGAIIGASLMGLLSLLIHR